jgi:hypothetical protein
MVDLRTPSSPHFTLRSTTFASPARRKENPVPKPPSPQVRSSPSPSSPGGPGSPARGTSTAMPRLTCGTLSLPCPTARSSTASCVSTQNSSKPSCCIWRLFCRRESALTKLWIARRCLSGTPSAGGLDGWPGMPTLVGAIAWDGMKALACSLRSTPLGSLPDSASGRPRPLISNWRRLSSP